MFGDLVFAFRYALCLLLYSTVLFAMSLCLPLFRLRWSRYGHPSRSKFTVDRFRRLRSQGRIRWIRWNRLDHKSYWTTSSRWTNWVSLTGCCRWILWSRSINPLPAEFSLWRSLSADMITTEDGKSLWKFSANYRLGCLWQSQGIPS